MTTDGRNATQAYRVRVGGTWYWVDPAVPPDAIEPGDTVVIYSAHGDATLALLQSALAPGRETVFATLEGERFTLPAGDIAALHLAAVDDDQGPVDGNGGPDYKPR
jgi:hypothetical protein